MFQAIVLFVLSALSLSSVVWLARIKPNSKSEHMALMVSIVVAGIGVLALMFLAGVFAQAHIEIISSTARDY